MKKTVSIISPLSKLVFSSVLFFSIFFPLGGHAFFDSGPGCIGICFDFGITFPCSIGLSSDRTTISSGETVTLTWSVIWAQSAQIINYGPVPTALINVLPSNVFVAPTQTTTYTGECTWSGYSLGFPVGGTNYSSPVTITVLQPVSGSCSVSPASAVVDQSVVWTATPSGGNGSYTYVWSGTDSLSGTSQSVSKTYSSTGTKTGSVVITSNGQSSTIACSNSVSVTTAPTQCSDGIDNDGDGRIDTNDYGCSGGGDTTESPNPQCSDGIDNDGDGRIDLNDYGCTGFSDTTESPNPQCSDGIDNNGNGLIDTADTVACSGPTDGNEEPLASGTATLTAPDLVRSGNSVTLTWSASDVQDNSCELTGTNGDSWDLAGTSGTKTSSAIITETTYTLSCTGLDGGTTTDVETVRVVPRYKEF